MKVAIVMGSISDMPVMQDAIDILKEFGIETEVDIVSAHRTPEKLFDFSQNAHKRGITVIIAGAGGAAHLPGMVAAKTTLPVIAGALGKLPAIDVKLNGVTAYMNPSRGLKKNHLRLLLKVLCSVVINFAFLFFIKIPASASQYCAGKR